VSAPPEKGGAFWCTKLSASSFLANGVVLAPVFGHAHDARARVIIGKQFPDREVASINAVALIEHGGAVGCVTQPQPLGVPPV